jgi:hypothetical protein
MRHDRFADARSVAVENIEQPCGQARLVRYPREQQCRQWSIFRRFQDDGIAGGERRGNLAGGVGQGIVPGATGAAVAVGFFLARFVRPD